MPYTSELTPCMLHAGCDLSEGLMRAIEGCADELGFGLVARARLRILFREHPSWQNDYQSKLEEFAGHVRDIRAEALAEEQ